MGRGWSIALLGLGLAVSEAAHAQSLGSFLSPGPLSADHAEYEGLTQCVLCHEAGRGVSAVRCLACHERVADQVERKEGYHADKGETCLPCHRDHRGRDFPLVTLEEKGFDHDPTGFPLEGAHADAECEDCHQGEGWDGLAQSCRSCHDDPHGAALSKRTSLASCEACHGVADWEVTSAVLARVFNHTDARQTDYVLRGAHLKVACEDCHAEAKFVPTPHQACTTCHEDPHRAPFADDCTRCHTEASWRVAGFDHLGVGYDLVGSHQDVGCAECHGKRVTDPVPHERCESCHRDPHARQFVPRDCESCHSVNQAAFALVGFDHARTDYPLEGRHAEVACAECHADKKKGPYRPIDHADCDDCHDDPHAGKFEPTDCRSCHTPEEWAVGEFDHARTDYPLEGKHASVECVACHPGEKWSGVKFGSCVDCHADDQPHAGYFADDRCASCHAVTGWQPVSFDHEVETDFVRSPQHTEVACEDCHVDPENYGVDDASCVACHADDEPRRHYDGDCDTCHQGADWLPADIARADHARTGFLLQGAHAPVACEACHAPSQPHSTASAACASCHAADDPHRHMLGDQCQDCHVPTVWARTRFRHEQTGWPLRGAHRLTSCDSCHATSYVGAPDDCRACHQGKAPPGVIAHQSPPFPACEYCHQPYTWASAFPH